MFEYILPPEWGERITYDDDAKINVPANPIVTYIEGDGVGAELTPLLLDVIDAAVSRAYKGNRRIAWTEVFCGEKAAMVYQGEWLPQETIAALKHYTVGIKGPLRVPMGAGFCSLNIALRRELDLYACVRRMRWTRGIPSPVRHPAKINTIIFRENTEYVYANLEVDSRALQTEPHDALLPQEWIKPDGDRASAIKLSSSVAARRIMSRALRHALENKIASITVMHKANMLPITEGVFYRGCLEEAVENFGATIEGAGNRYIVTEGEHQISIELKIADAVFQEVLSTPEQHEIIVCSNLNGDYLSDVIAACVGGASMCPSANIGSRGALFEPVHGTAPQIAGHDLVNPCSIYLSGAELLDYLGWEKAAQLIRHGIFGLVKQRRLTRDLANSIEGAEELSTSEFTDALITKMGARFT